MYDISLLVKEVGNIEELENSVKVELTVLEKRWKLVVKWSDERNKKLSNIVSLWTRLKQEQADIRNWIDEKSEQLQVADAINLADEDAVSEQLNIIKVCIVSSFNSTLYHLIIFIGRSNASVHFQSLQPERENYLKRVTEVEALGQELQKAIVKNNNAKESIQHQIADLDKVFNELLGRILNKTAQVRICFCW